MGAKDFTIILRIIQQKESSKTFENTIMMDKIAILHKYFFSYFGIMLKKFTWDNTI